MSSTFFFVFYLSLKTRVIICDNLRKVNTFFQIFSKKFFIGVFALFLFFSVGLFLF